MSAPVEDDEPHAGGHGGQPAAREGYDVGRLLAFSDGVFAIAITLLVLSIPVPSVPLGPNEGAQLREAFVQLVPNLVGFGLSFVLVGAQWIAHHRMLRRLDRCNTTILWLNLALLLGICLVPFATGVLIRYGSEGGDVAYATVQSAIGLTFLVMRAYLVRRGLVDRLSLLVSIVPIVAFIVSIPLALGDANLAYAVWVAGFAIARVIEARTHRDPPPAPG